MSNTSYTTLFTKEQSIAIQSENLKEYKEILKRDCYLRLLEWATATNDKVTDPYKIRRGTSLSNALHNVVINCIDMERRIVRIAKKYKYRLDPTKATDVCSVANLINIKNKKDADEMLKCYDYWKMVRSSEH